jgi:two-component system, OmpR family, response regulator
MTKVAKKYQGKKALLVDDDSDFQILVKLYLETIGFEVTVGDSQKDGEKLIQEGKYDLAIFDLMMENSDSGFILSYKSKIKHPEMPIIIVTNVTNETGFQFDVSTKEMRSWIKADAIMDKDIRKEQLLNEIEKLIG